MRSVTIITAISHLNDYNTNIHCNSRSQNQTLNNVLTGHRGSRYL